MSSKIIRASDEEPHQVRRFTYNPALPAVPVSPPFLLPLAALEANRRILRIEPPGQPEPDADQQRDFMLRDARTKALEIEKAAHEMGFAEGQKASSEDAEKKVESLLWQYSVSLEQLNKLRREVFSSSEREVIRLALEIARKVVTREVAIDEDLILTLVKVAMNRIVGQALVTIRVNPMDYQVIQRHHAAQPEAGPLNETMKLVEDPLIGRGGCVIETESGTIDARIEEQFREIERGLFE